MQAPGNQNEDHTMAMKLNVTVGPIRSMPIPTTPLLYVLRDDLALNGAKYGCGLGQCGSCTVMVDGEAVFSCVTPILLLEGRESPRWRGWARSRSPGRCSGPSSRSRRPSAATAFRA